MWPLVTGGLFALALGMRHAVEPDHLAAVSTLVADELRLGRARGHHRWRAALLGLFWGCGHTLALFVVAAVLASLRARLSVRVDDLFELVVAGTLLFLGARAVRRAAVAGRHGPERPHAHAGQADLDEARHLHPGPADHLHVGPYTLARQPLLVGLLHGLAGSGALTVVGVASAPSATVAMWFLGWFGVGATLGMALCAGFGGALLGRVLRTPRAQVWLVGVAGALSLVIGAWKGWPLAVRLLGA